jgi:hypothetical protein
MKKTLLFLLSVISTVAMAQTITVSPKYGCPGATHTVTISFSNPSPFTITSYDVNIDLKDGSTVLANHTQTYSNSVPAGGTGMIIITGVPFTSVADNTVCTATGTVVAQTGFGPQNVPVNQNYTVKYPPTFSIADGAGTLSAVEPLDGYSIRFYLNGDYGTVINESVTGSYTPTQTGDYSAKGYDPISTCISQTASNTVNVIVTAITNAQNINVSVYPNPMVNSLTIAADNMQVTYSISNTIGVSVKSGSINQVGSIVVDDLQAGTYVLTVKDNSGKSSSYTLVK